MGSTRTIRQRHSVRSKMGDDNPHYNASTSLAYVILAGTSFWAFRHTSKDSPWAIGTFSFLLGHSLVGVLHFSHPSGFKKVQTVFEVSALVAEVIPLPMLNTDLYFLSSMDQKIALAHAVSALIPIGTHFTMDKHNDKMIDSIILINVISLVYFTITRDFPWAGGMAVLTILNHFVFTRISERFEVPKMDLVAVGLSFFNVFAVNCLCEAKFKN